MNSDTIQLWLEQNPLIFQGLAIVGILLACFINYYLTKKIVLPFLSKLAQKTKNKFDDLIFHKNTLRYLPVMISLVTLYYFLYLLPEAHAQIFQRILTAIIIFLIAMTIGAVISVINEYYNNQKFTHGRSIKGYLEIIKLIMYIFIIVIIIGILTGQSPLVLLSGVGALTAVLLLIFRDTILSLVASMQITSYDLVRVGDWIEVPKYGADGDVIDIALHTVKVQNWDKTISIIPTHKLIEDTFKNWRGMQKAGGRRIKRAIYIDTNSIKFCDEQMIKRIKKIQLLKNYIREKKKEIEQFNKEKNIDENSLVNGRRITNIGTFRAYIEAYLFSHQKIHKGLVYMVRQLAPGPNGLPLEIYVFANDIDWKNYETIQSDIFDHIFAVIGEFDLHVFQNPTGKDFTKITKQ